MPPAATFCQSWLDRAVGPAAKSRNVDGSTPSTATNLPLTWIRAASTARAACTPGSRATRAAALAGSASCDTTRMSTRISLPTGATSACRAAAVTATAGATSADCRRLPSGAAGTGTSPATGTPITCRPAACWLAACAAGSPAAAVTPSRASAASAAGPTGRATACRAQPRARTGREVTDPAIPQPRSAYQGAWSRLRSAPSRLRAGQASGSGPEPGPEIRLKVTPCSGPGRRAARPAR